jgi:hypothetical protein
MAKSNFKDIDALKSSTFSIRFGGETYEITDPATRQVYILKSLTEKYQEANAALQANPKDDNTFTLYEKCVRNLVSEGLEVLTGKACDTSNIELRLVEACAIQINELSGDAFMKGRGLGM